MCIRRYTPYSPNALPPSSAQINQIKAVNYTVGQRAALHTFNTSHFTGDGGLQIVIHHGRQADWRS